MKSKSQNQKDSIPYVSEDLEKMRLYATEELRKLGDDIPLVATESFVRGMRDSGYRSTATAIDEFIDNSIQAQADAISILIGYPDRNPSKKKLDAESGGYIAIVDNGHGMDPEMIRLAVVWGGTHRENDRTGLGRYGFGLPSAAVSISRSFEVYSKVPGGEWWMVRVDLDAIAKGKLRAKSGTVAVPKAVKAALPTWVLEGLGKTVPEQGTLVVLDQADRLSVGYVQAMSFKENLLHHVGLVFREFLRNVSMTLVDVGNVVDVTNIEPIDPLFLREDARYYNELPTVATARPEARFTMKAKNGKEGLVTVRYSLMAPDFMNKGTSRFRVRKDNNGFIMMRAGRQIDVVTKNPFLVMMNNDRYWACEISFDPGLDEEFGITTNKQQVTVSDRLWDILAENGVRAAVKQLHEEYFHLAYGDGAKKHAKVDKESEDIAAKTEKFRKRREIPVKPEREREGRKKLDEEVERVKRETGQAEEEIRDDIEARPFKIDFEDLPGAPFFRMLQVGGQRRVLINIAHRFYTDLYAGPATTPRVKTSLELLLIVLGECELDAASETEKFYRVERNEWARRLDIMLEELDRREPVRDHFEALDPDTREVPGSAV